MISFILAGMVFVLTCIVTLIMVLAAAMSDSPSAAETVPVIPVSIGGVVLTLLLIASHWMPQLSW